MYTHIFTCIHTDKLAHAHTNAKIYIHGFKQDISKNISFTLNCCQQNAIQVIIPPEPFFYISFLSFLFFFTFLPNYPPHKHPPTGFNQTFSTFNLFSRQGFFHIQSPAQILVSRLSRSSGKFDGSLSLGSFSHPHSDFCDQSIRLQPQGDALFSEIRETAAVHTGCPLSLSLPILLLIEMQFPYILF